jgi:hypothetical protein
MVAIQNKSLNNMLTENLDIESSWPVDSGTITIEELKNIQTELTKDDSLSSYSITEPQDSFGKLDSLESPTHNPWL